MQWIGWYRLREGLPWKRACQGDTWISAPRRLNAATKNMKIRDTDCIMTGAHRRTFPPPRRAKRTTR